MLLYNVTLEGSVQVDYNQPWGACLVVSKAHPNKLVRCENTNHDKAVVYLKNGEIVRK